MHIISIMLAAFLVAIPALAGSCESLNGQFCLGTSVDSGDSRCCGASTGDPNGFLVCNNAGDWEFHNCKAGQTCNSQTLKC